MYGRKKVQKQNILNNVLNVKDDLQIFQKLPEEITIYIFEFLPIADRIKVERVCQSWKVLAKQSWSNTKELKLTPQYLGLKPICNKYYKINDSILDAVLKRCGNYIRKIDVAQLTCRSSSIVAKYCKNVHSITCDQVSVNGLKNLSTFCTKIKQINIQSCILDNVDDALGYLFSKNKMLQVIEIPY